MVGRFGKAGPLAIEGVEGNVLERRTAQGIRQGGGHLRRDVEERQRLVERRGLMRVERTQLPLQSLPGRGGKAKLLRPLLDVGRFGLGETGDGGCTGRGRRDESEKAGRDIAERTRCPSPRRGRSRSYVRNTVLVCGPIARNRGEGSPADIPVGA